MPRPILKTLSSFASPVRYSDSASKRKEKRVGVRRHVGTCRRVTFSPFTKLQIDSPTRSQLPLFNDGEKPQGSLTSGFTFSSATETEKKNQSRRKEELQIIEILYQAAMSRPHSMKSLLLAYVPGLKRLNTLASKWTEYAKAMRKAVRWPQHARPKRRPRRLLRGRWTDFDDADYKYVQHLVLRSTTRHPTVLLPASSSSIGNKYRPLATFHRSPQPDLAPASRGGFTSLLRKEGISVDEDERKEKRAVDEDLRGLNHRHRIRW